MALSELTKVVPPPAKPKKVPKAPRWDLIEKKLGTKLPSDYRAYCEHYGQGLFGNFAFVYTPFTGDDSALVPEALGTAAILRDLKESEGDQQVPYDIYPDSPGLLLWGGDQNGNRYYWLTKGARNKWPVVVLESRGPRSQQFDMPMTTFLAKALAKAIRVKVWPKDFPKPPRTNTFDPG